jgi:hypothetical protein
MNARTVFLSVILASGAAFCQEEPDLQTESLVERAARVQQQYPWLVQETRGLSVYAFNIPREEFLRGAHATTDLVFDGTSELPDRISLRGFFANITKVFDKLDEQSPDLRYRTETLDRRVTFYHAKDEAAGLPPRDLIARYRLGRIPSPQAPSGTGMFLPGSLIVQGTLFPPPLQVDVMPNPAGGNVVVMANSYPVQKIDFVDPLQMEREFREADSPERVKRVLGMKASQIWLQTAQIPFATTSERLNLAAGQMAYAIGAFKTRVEGESLQIELPDGSKMFWSPRQTPPTMPLSEPEAFQKAYTLQSEILSSLAEGSVVFCSDRFGMRAVRDAMSFLAELSQIASDARLSAPEKEGKIRQRWPADRDWILEYFYTTLLDEAAPPPPGGPYAPPLPPVVLPTPNIPNRLPPNATPDEIIKQLLEKSGKQ